jgi:protein-S-isoprenylcysteine O-methyltransferase Ste14
VDRPLKLLSTIAFLVLVATLVFLFANHSLIANGWAARAVQIAAVAFMIWARITFGTRSFHLAANPTAGGLVTTGPYRFVRHPIYFSILLLMGAAIVSHWSLRNGVTGLVAIAAVLTRALSEETLVRKRYPEYADYARRTSRLLPFVY